MNRLLYFADAYRSDATLPAGFYLHSRFLCLLLHLRSRNLDSSATLTFRDPRDVVSNRMHLNSRVLIAAMLLLVGCTSVRRLQQPLPAVSSIHSPEFAQATGSILGASFQPGNRITTLNDGEEIFPAMLRAIRQARRSINFETFVFHRSEVAQEFVDALVERARWSPGENDRRRSRLAGRG